MKTKIKFGFRNENQLPLFMIWKEFLNEDSQIVFAKVIFKI